MLLHPDTRWFSTGLPFLALFIHKRRTRFHILEITKGVGFIGIWILIIVLLNGPDNTKFHLQQAWETVQQVFHHPNKGVNDYE